MTPSPSLTTRLSILSFPGEIHHLVFLELEPIELLSVGQVGGIPVLSENGV
jgi:hypothetical protein